MHAPTFIRETKISASERKAIEAARGKIAGILAIIHEFTPDSKSSTYNRFSAAHGKRDAAERAFISNPTAETAAAFHRSLVFLREIETTFAEIDGASHESLREHSLSLGPITAAIVNRAKETVESEIVRARAVVSGDPSLRHDLPAFEARATAARAALEGEAAEAARDPLAWIESHGLAMD